jgi:hypothetical protein
MAVLQSKMQNEKRPISSAKALRCFSGAMISSSPFVNFYRMALRRAFG